MSTRRLPTMTRFDASWSLLIAYAFATCGLAADVLAAPSDPLAVPIEDEPGAGNATDQLDVDGLVLHPVQGPPVAEVVAAAYSASGLDHHPTRGLIRRARLGGLVPWLTVRTGRNTSWQNDDPTIDKGMAVEVRATWRLDRLVFDGHELQVVSIEAARRRERRRVSRAVIRSYFTWRRAAVRASGHFATRSNVLAADEAAAELDALTNGWFSEALLRPRRTASETRTP